VRGVKKVTSHNLINVALQPETYQRLRKLGQTPDSFNDIVERLLDANEKGEISKNENK
jgi:predicted CopG family antitoxin